jgi:hypothetical protein
MPPSEYEDLPQIGQTCFAGGGETITDFSLLMVHLA